MVVVVVVVVVVVFGALSLSTEGLGGESGVLGWSWALFNVVRAYKDQPELLTTHNHS